MTIEVFLLMTRRFLMSSHFVDIRNRGQPVAFHYTPAEIEAALLNDDE